MTTHRSKPLSIAAAALVLALSAAPAPAQQQASEPPSVGVVTARIVRIAPKMALPGSVVSLNDSQLAAEVEGRVAWVADVGTVIPAGGVIARIDQSVAKTQLDSDRANVAKLAAQLRFDRAQASRMDSLYQQNAIAKATRDQAASTRDVDVGALAQAQAALRKSKYQYDHSIIRAPFPGRVVQRLINIGEYAMVGKPIVRFVDIGSLEVSAQTPIDSARHIREGLKITMEIEGHPVEGTVRAIVPVGDLVSRSLEVRITIASNAGFVGDAAKVFIPSAEPRDVIAVPRDALILREDNTYVFKVDRKSTAQRVAVETGSEDGALVEIKGQIAPGERVIVRGAERLEAGQKVRAVGAS